VPVDLVTIHHEGSLANGGAPVDPPQLGRFAEGGYCYGIGATVWERWRAPVDNWATLNFNGEDLTLCWSGDRHTGYPITDLDLELLHGAFLDSYNRGEVTASPQVRAHRNSPGSATACPGDFTMARWGEVEAACRATGAPPATGAPAPPTTTGGDDDMPGTKDYVDALSTDDGAWLLQYDGGVETIRGPFYGSYFTLPANVRNDPTRRFLSFGPVPAGGKGYSLLSLRGERYEMTTRQ
jgi:hypothetical protein